MPNPWQVRQVKKDRCPKCHHEFTHAATPDGSKPQPRDFTICINLRGNSRLGFANDTPFPHCP